MKDLNRLLKTAIVIAALLYSAPRLCYFGNIRYDRIVIDRLERIQKDDAQHIAWHRKEIEKLKPEAAKGAAAFLLAIFMIFLLFLKKDR